MKSEMRKLKTNLLLVVFAFMLASCGDNITNVNTNWKIVDLEVKSTDWIENVDAYGKNRYYSCHFNMPEITSFIFNSGTVNTFIKFVNVQQPLPYVQHLENSDSSMRWTRTVDYEYLVGGLNVFVTNSNFVRDTPVTMHFRVVLMW